MERGKFIVFEGMDGGGKGTQVDLLRQRIGSKSNVVFTKEHNRQGVAGELVERVVTRQETRDFSPRALQQLFIADRVDHWDRVIRPALEAGKLVVSDRYWPSTVAYGPIDQREVLVGINRQVVGDPDLAILVDVPVEVAMARMNLRGEPQTIFEKREKLKVVRQGYLWQVEKMPDMWLVVNGDRDPEVIAVEIWGEIKRREMV